MKDDERVILIDIHKPSHRHRPQIVVVILLSLPFMTHFSKRECGMYKSKSRKGFMGSGLVVRHRRSTNMQQPLHDIPAIFPSVWYKRSCCSAERFNDAVASRVSSAPDARAAMSLG